MAWNHRFHHNGTVAIRLTTSDGPVTLTVVPDHHHDDYRMLSINAPQEIGIEIAPRPNLDKPVATPQ